MRLKLDIGDVIVRTDGERHKLEHVAPAVEEAFRLLAKHLEGTPFGRFGDWRERVVATLQTDVVALDELLSSRGAERLADQMYRQLTERRS